jgi:hypothetical protein
MLYIYMFWSYQHFNCYTVQSLSNNMYQMYWGIVMRQRRTHVGRLLEYDCVYCRNRLRYMLVSRTLDLFNDRVCTHRLNTAHVNVSSANVCLRYTHL